MGARHTEFALGLWLMLSPVLFGHAESGDLLWLHDVLLGTLLTVVPLLCYVRRLHRAHLALLAVAGWLLGRGWWITRTLPDDPAAQNHVMVGLLLAMVAIVPSRATDRPTGWRHDRATTTDA